MSDEAPVQTPSMIERIEALEQGNVATPEAAQEAQQIREAISVLLARRGNARLERGGVDPVEDLYSDVEVRGLGEPVVDQLPRPPVDIATGDEDVLVAEQVGQSRVDRRHPAVKIPSHELLGQWAALEVDHVVRERD